MIVAVESNFVLELAFRQGEAAHCERLIALAEQRVIELTIPGCSLFEPLETLVRRIKHREDVSEMIRSELAQLARSEGHASLRETANAVTRAFSESCEVQGEALDMTLDRISSIATVIPLTAEIVRHALMMRLIYSLPRQDSVVMASIDRLMSERGAGSKLFATRNSRDFGKGPVRAHLRQRDCEVVMSFSAACSVIEHTVETAS